MKLERHGLLIGIERSGNRFFLSLKAQEKLTHKDYETITPMIDSALAEVRHPQGQGSSGRNRAGRVGAKSRVE